MQAVPGKENLFSWGQFLESPDSWGLLADSTSIKEEVSLQSWRDLLHMIASSSVYPFCLLKSAFSYNFWEWVHKDSFGPLSMRDFHKRIVDGKNYGP